MVRTSHNQYEIEVFQACCCDGNLEGISREVWGIGGNTKTRQVVVDESDDHVYMEGD